MVPYYKNDKGILYYGDAIDISKRVKPESVHCCVTSPPYWGLRAYGNKEEYGEIEDQNQLGLEKTPEQYIDHLIEIFKGVKKVLHPQGTLWVNIADTNCVPSSVREAILKMKPGVPAKNRVGIPWKLALALQRDDWHLRADIIWWKRNAPREPVDDRPTYEHEYIFLFSKEQQYFYDKEAVGLQYKGKYAGDRDGVIKASGGMFHAGENIKADLDYRNLGSVWDIPTEPHPEYHFASFPTKLVERCIKAGTSRVGCCSKCFTPIIPIMERKTKTSARKTVGWKFDCNCNGDMIPCTTLDPFSGRGTVPLTSEVLGRSWIATEKIPEYCELIKQNIINRGTGLLPLNKDSISNGLFNKDELDISIK